MDDTVYTQTQTTPNGTTNEQPKIYYWPPPQPGAGPPCIWDNCLTQKAGSCYVCPLCGSTSACG